MRIENGNKARDLVSGFEGVVICTSAWLTGCDTLLLKPAVDKDGKSQESQSFDRNQLEFVDKGVTLPSETPPTKRDSGGPHPDAPTSRV